MNVFRTDLARDEIAAAFDRLEDRSASAAERLAEQVDQACRLIGANPRIGKDRSNLRPGYLSRTVGDYQLFYRVTATEVIVLRFIHGSRDMEAALAEAAD